MLLLGLEATIYLLRHAFSQGESYRNGSRCASEVGD